MYQRILVALDGGTASEAALDDAIPPAQAMGAEVEVIYAVDDSSPFLDVTGMDPDRLIDDLMMVGESVLSSAANKLGRAGVRHCTRLLSKHMIQDDIATTIVAEAAGWPADLIVMGTHGRRSARRLIMGSVSRGRHRPDKPTSAAGLSGQGWHPQPDFVSR
ncbi:universal stress protein [Cupriavidus sp. WKF15]|uniref:universal stress protein n=1 Tax=Cupriavidus sp. WKF15 TaxID=3032282 RepID=UPI0023E13618|nr:universal stress protein [Cupriavidus sp. WKF15]WER50370.1 universal stress protein [Cupriavidus sp. WKF15]